MSEKTDLKYFAQKNPLLSICRIRCYWIAQQTIAGNTLPGEEWSGFMRNFNN
jgi:hypothetical protein